MPRADRRVRRPRSRGARSRQLKRSTSSSSERLTQPRVRDPGDLLARILESPQLAHAVPRLPPVILHRLIQSCGLEDCGELVALATPEQLSAVFDLDLWRSGQPGMDEELDAARFAVWLEVLAESGAAFAARRLAKIDLPLVIAALSRYIAVFDAAVVDGAEVVIPSALKGSVSREFGGYVVAAKRSDSWDTIVDVLFALEEQARDCFHHVMNGCRRLSNSKPELDGFHDLMTDPEQTLFDLAVDRERRREQLGYVTAAEARAFLQASRQVHLEHHEMPPPNPIWTAYVRVADEPDAHAEDGATSESGDPPRSEASESAVAAVVDVLRDAGVIPDQPRALLGASHGQTQRRARIQRHMQFVRDDDPAAYALRTRELAFLANVIVAGCSVQARPFTAREAFDAAVATCNLGLENWPLQWLPQQSQARVFTIDSPRALPEDLLADHDLASVFQVGWTVLYKDVCLFVTRELLGILDALQCSDQEIQMGLYKLRREMTRHLEKGAPWHACDALDVIAMLDLPAWAALLGLIAECPVMLTNVSLAGHSQPHSVDPKVFEYISENSHIMAVRTFVRSMAGALSL